jgi:flagellar hook-associated protein 3 FlgL
VQAKLTKVQEQLSTGLQIVKPSDEPDKASLVTRLESELARQAGYQDTLKAVNVRLTAEETALKNTSDVMYRIKELGVQAANDTLSLRSNFEHGQQPRQQWQLFVFWQPCRRARF